MNSDILHITASFALGAVDLFCFSSGAGLYGVPFADFSNEMFRAFSDKFGVSAMSVSSPHLSGGVWFTDVSAVYHPAGTALAPIRGAFRVYLTFN